MTEGARGLPPDHPADGGGELPEGQAAHRRLRRTRPDRGFWHRNGRRIGVGIAGFGLVIAGVVLSLPLVPGPGFVIIIAGLAILATEFEWAERWLHRARARFDAAARRAGLKPRVAGWIVVVVLVAGALAAGGLWLAFR